MRGSVFFCSILSVWRKLQPKNVVTLALYQPSKMTVLGMCLPNLPPTYTLSIYVGETQTPPAVTDSLKWTRPWNMPEREPIQWAGVDGPCFWAALRPYLITRYIHWG